jgi:hypothetical protein
VLRRERLYQSHIEEWTAARDAGALTGLGGARRFDRRVDQGSRRTSSGCVRRTSD